MSIFLLAKPAGMIPQTTGRSQGRIPNFSPNYRYQRGSLSFQAPISLPSASGPKTDLTDPQFFPTLKQTGSSYKLYNPFNPTPEIDLSRVIDRVWTEASPRQESTVGRGASFALPLDLKSRENPKIALAETQLKLLAWKIALQTYPDKVESRSYSSIQKRLEEDWLSVQNLVDPIVEKLRAQAPYAQAEFYLLRNILENWNSEERSLFSQATLQIRKTFQHQLSTLQNQNSELLGGTTRGLNHSLFRAREAIENPEDEIIGDPETKPEPRGDRIEDQREKKDPTTPGDAVDPELENIDPAIDPDIDENNPSEGMRLSDDGPRDITGKKLEDLSEEEILKIAQAILDGFSPSINQAKIKVLEAVVNISVNRLRAENVKFSLSFLIENLTTEMTNHAEGILRKEEPTLEGQPKDLVLDVLRRKRDHPDTSAEDRADINNLIEIIGNKSEKEAINFALNFFMPLTHPEDKDEIETLIANHNNDEANIEYIFLRIRESMSKLFRPEIIRAYETAVAAQRAQDQTALAEAMEEDRIKIGAELLGDLNRGLEEAGERVINANVNLLFSTEKGDQLKKALDDIANPDGQTQEQIRQIVIATIKRETGAELIGDDMAIQLAINALQNELTDTSDPESPEVMNIVRLIHILRNEDVDAVNQHLIDLLAQIGSQSIAAPYREIYRDRIILGYRNPDDASKYLSVFDEQLRNIEKKLVEEGLEAALETIQPLLEQLREVTDVSTKSRLIKEIQNSLRLILPRGPRPIEDYAPFIDGIRERFGVHYSAYIGILITEIANVRIGQITIIEIKALLVKAGIPTDISSVTSLAEMIIPQNQEPTFADTLITLEYLINAFRGKNDVVTHQLTNLKNRIGTAISSARKSGIRPGTHPDSTLIDMLTTEHQRLLDRNDLEGAAYLENYIIGNDGLPFVDPNLREFLVFQLRINRFTKERNLPAIGQEASLMRKYYDRLTRGFPGVYGNPDHIIHQLANDVNTARGIIDRASTDQPVPTKRKKRKRKRLKKPQRTPPKNKK